MVAAWFTVLSLLAAGYLLRRLGRLPDNAAHVLNRIIVDLCVPATILRLVPKLSLSPGLAALVIIPWAMAGVAYLVVRAASRPLGLDATQRTALFLATALGNTSFLGFPLVGALLGERAIPLAAVYDQLGSFLLLGTVAPLALAGVTAGPRPRPAFLEPLLVAAASPLVPLAMIAVGLKLRLTPPRPARVFVVGLVLKLLLLPCAAWLLARALGAPPLVTKVAVLETAMPTMITAGALMMAQGIASDLCAAFVGWGIVISLVTVPAWSLALR